MKAVNIRIFAFAAAAFAIAACVVALPLSHNKRAAAAHCPDGAIVANMNATACICPSGFTYNSTAGTCDPLQLLGAGCPYDALPIAVGEIQQNGLQIVSTALEGVNEDQLPVLRIVLALPLMQGRTYVDAGFVGVVDDFFYEAESLSKRGCYASAVIRDFEPQQATTPCTEIWNVTVAVNDMLGCATLRDFAWPVIDPIVHYKDTGAGDIGEYIEPIRYLHNWYDPPNLNSPDLPYSPPLATLKFSDISGPYVEAVVSQNEFHIPEFSFVSQYVLKSALKTPGAIVTPMRVVYTSHWPFAITSWKNVDSPFRSPIELAIPPTATVACTYGSQEYYNDADNCHGAAPLQFVVGNSTSDATRCMFDNYRYNLTFVLQCVNNVTASDCPLTQINATMSEGSVLFTVTSDNFCDGLPDNATTTTTSAAIPTTDGALTPTESPEITQTNAATEAPACEASTVTVTVTVTATTAPAEAETLAVTGTASADTPGLTPPETPAASPSPAAEIL